MSDKVNAFMLFVLFILGKEKEWEVNPCKYIKFIRTLAWILVEI